MKIKKTILLMVAVIMACTMVACDEANKAANDEQKSKTQSSGKSQSEDTLKKDLDDVKEDIVKDKKKKDDKKGEEKEEHKAYKAVLFDGGECYYSTGEALDFIDYYDAKHYRYSFVDLNDDGVDELLVELYGCWLNVLIYENGKVVEIETPFYSGATREIIQNNKVVTLFDDVHDARIVYDAYKLNKDNRFDHIVYFAHWFPTRYNEEVEESYMKYTEDMDSEEGEEISAKEYTDLVKEYAADEMEIDWIEVGDESENPYLEEDVVYFDFSLRDFSFGGYNIGADMYELLANSDIPNLVTGDYINPYIAMKPFDGYSTDDEDNELNCYTIMYVDDDYYCLKELTLSKKDKPHYKGYIENFSGPITLGMDWDEVAEIILGEEIDKKAYEVETDKNESTGDWHEIRYHFKSNLFGQNSLLIVHEDGEMILSSEDNDDEIYMLFDEDYILSEIDIQKSR